MTLEEIITPKLLLSVDKLMLNIKANSVSAVSGKRKSNQKGSSLDFSDYRTYTQGDDIRKIDWNGYARSGKTNIKLYNEEKQSNVNIILDSSKSMDFGEDVENKFIYASLLSALLAYTHIKNEDNVNVYAFEENLMPISINNASRQRFNSMIKQIDKINISKAISDKKKYKFNIMKKGGLTFVISDFYTENGYMQIIKELQELGQRVVLIHILSKQEINPEFSGDYALLDSEENVTKTIFVNYDVISEYKNLLNIHKNEIKKYSNKRNVMYFDVSTDINILDTIFKILNRE